MSFQNEEVIGRKTLLKKRGIKKTKKKESKNERKKDEWR